MESCALIKTPHTKAFQYRGKKQSETQVCVSVLELILQIFQVKPMELKMELQCTGSSQFWN